MHPIQDLFLESFSYELQFDMHFYMHSYLHKFFYSCKKWVLHLKTKQASVYRLRYKTDGGRLAQDTHRDLVACLAWKQVWLGFLCLA
jgi:hypothetical protein